MMNDLICPKFFPIFDGEAGWANAHICHSHAPMMFSDVILIKIRRSLPVARRLSSVQLHREKRDDKWLLLLVLLLLLLMMKLMARASNDASD